LDSIVIKEFVKGQEDYIVTIHNQAFKNLIEDLGELYCYKFITKYDVENWTLNNHSKIFIIYFNKEPIGYTHCQVEEITGKSKIKELVFIETKESLSQSKIAIIPKYQNQGFGKILINHAINYFADIDSILVLAYNDNHAMTFILSKLGFKHEKLFFYSKYSLDKPYSNDSVLAYFNLNNQIPKINYNEKVTVRPIEKKDYNAMQQIFGESRPDVFGTNPSFENIVEWIDSGWGEVTLVAEFDGKTVGCMEFTKKGVIGIPGILLDYRKKGIGSTLFYNLLRKMKEMGYKKALADTGFVLEDAIKMYKKFNFNLNRELWSWIKIIRK